MKVPGQMQWQNAATSGAQGGRIGSFTGGSLHMGGGLDSQTLLIAGAVALGAILWITRK